MRMDIVGPPLWRSLHAITFAYSDTPTPEQRAAVISFFESLTALLPCTECQQNFVRELAHSPLRDHVHNRDTLSRWLVDLHNRVNVRLGKPELPYEAVAAEYAECASQCTAPTVVPGLPTSAAETIAAAAAGTSVAPPCCTQNASKSDSNSALNSDSNSNSWIWWVVGLLLVLAALVFTFALMRGSPSFASSSTSLWNLRGFKSQSLQSN